MCYGTELNRAFNWASSGRMLSHLAKSCIVELFFLPEAQKRRLCLERGIGKEHRNYHDEVIWGYIGIMENKMEITIMGIWALYRDNGR